MLNCACDKSEQMQTEPALVSKYHRHWELRQTFYQLALLLLLHSAAIACFASGFLLTRVELHQDSQCNDLKDSKAMFLTQEDKGLGGVNTSAGCWGRQHFDKLLLVVVDALRYDFAVPLGSGPSNIPVLQQLANEAVSIFKAQTRRYKLTTKDDWISSMHEKFARATMHILALF